MVLGARNHVATIGGERHAVHVAVMPLEEVGSPAHHLRQAHRAIVRTRDDVAAVTGERDGKHPVVVTLNTAQLQSLGCCKTRGTLRRVHLDILTADVTRSCQSGYGRHLGSTPTMSAPGPNLTTSTMQQSRRLPERQRT